MRRPLEDLRSDEILSTYRYVRLAMPVLAFMLLFSVGWQIFTPLDTPDNCWLGSISAYYYTAARAVFVATLCAIGTCLFVYRGSTDREDVALNISGALAFFVALIPTPLKDVEEGEPLCKRANVPDELQLETALQNNVWTALATGLVVALIYVLLRRNLPATEGWGRPKLNTVRATLALAVAGMLLFGFSPDTVIDLGHYVSAGLLFIGVGYVVVINAYPDWAGDEAVKTPERTGYQNWYAFFLGLMAVALVVIGALKAFGPLDNWLFWVELSLIVLFAVFWSVQTKEHWRPEPDEQVIES